MRHIPLLNDATLRINSFFLVKSVLVLTSNEEIGDASLNINMWEIAYLFENDIFHFYTTFESKSMFF